MRRALPKIKCGNMVRMTHGFPLEGMLVTIRADQGYVDTYQSGYWVPLASLTKITVAASGFSAETLRKIRRLHRGGN